MEKTLDQYRAFIHDRDLMLYQREIELEQLLEENRRLARELAIARSEASRFSKILHALNFFKK